MLFREKRERPKGEDIETTRLTMPTVFDVIIKPERHN